MIWEWWGRVGLWRFWLGQGKAKLHCNGGTINYSATEGTSRKGLKMGLMKRYSAVEYFTEREIKLRKYIRKQHINENIHTCSISSVLTPKFSKGSPRPAVSSQRQLL